MAQRISEQVIEWLSVGGNAFSSQATVPLVVSQAGKTATIPTTNGTYLGAYFNQTQVWILGAGAASANVKSGQLVVSTSDTGAGADAAIELWRGTSASWQFANISGTLHIRNNYTSSAQTTYSQDSMTIAYNTGITTLNGTTDSTSTSTGTLIVKGGVGIAKQLRVGGVTTHGDDVVSDTDNTDTLGTTAVRWKEGYFNSILNIGTKNTSYNTATAHNTYISPASIILNAHSAAGGFYNYLDGVQYGRFYISAKGTAPTATETTDPDTGEVTTTYSGYTQGYAHLELGNNKVGANTASGVINNARGRIRIYGAGSTYTDLLSNPNGSKTVYLPYGNTTMYLAWTPASNTAEGGTAKPVYAAAGGKLVALSATVGSATKPVYLNSGTITVSNGTVGSGIIPMYLSSGTLTASTSTVGSATKPIYLNVGTITVGTYELKATINAGTQWGVAYFSTTTNLTSTAAGTSGYLLQGNGSAAPSWIQATNANTASTIVKRDASGNFSAGTITATLNGNASTTTKLAHITLNSTTINNTAGSFAFSGSGEPWDGTDWVGLQIGDGVDKFQIAARENTLLFRQNDSGGTNTSWNNWVTMLTSANFSSYAAAASHTHPINQITWASSQNLALTAPTANGAEYSIDMPNTTYTGSYWHVWSGKNSASILSCYNDDRSVVIGGALKLSTSGLVYPNAAGYYTNEYGNLIHSRDTATDYFNINSNAVVTKLRVYYESGRIVVSNYGPASNRPSSGYAAGEIWFQT